MGTTDVDLVIRLAVEEDPPDTYYTLATNLERAGFKQVDPSFRWERRVEGVLVAVELLGEAEGEPAGKSFRPRGQRTGSGLSLLNIPGTHLVGRDHVEVDVTAERLDGGGDSTVPIRVANLLPYGVLKIHAYQDRHENKDAYDLVFTLLHFEGGPELAGRAAAGSPIAGEAQVLDAMELMRVRFATPTTDGPIDYATFVSSPGDDAEVARRRQEAVATIRVFCAAFGEARGR